MSAAGGGKDATPYSARIELASWAIPPGRPAKRPAHEKHARYDPVVHHVIAAPGALVVREDVTQGLPGSRFGRTAVALRVADDQIGPAGTLFLVLVVASALDLRDDGFTGLRIDHGQQFRSQLLNQFEPLRRRHDAVPLTAAQVDVQARKADAVCPRPLPIDVQQELLFERVRVRTSGGQVALLEQPGVEVEGAAPGGEPVVRHDDEQGLFAVAVAEPSFGFETIQGLPDDRIQALVEGRNQVGVGGVDLRVVGRVVRIARTPAHVADLVDVAEVVEEQASRLLQVLVQHVAVLFRDLVAGDLRLGQELVGSEHVFGQGLRILGHPLGVEAVHRLRQLRGEVRRRRDGRRGRHRIVVDRTHVELELRFERAQVHATDAPQMLGRHHLEVDLEPVAPLPHPEHDLLVADLYLGALGFRIEVDREGGGQLLRLTQQRVGGPQQFGLDHIVVDIQFDDVTAADIAVGEQFRGVEGERALGAEDIRRAHAGEFAACRARDREVGRHADDLCPHAVLLQDLPERGAVPELRVLAARERELPAPHLQ